MSNHPQTLTEKVLKGSSIVLVFTLLGSPIGYLIRVLYSNSLSIEMFGLFYAALAFFSLLSTYLDFGLGFSCSYFIPKFLKNGDKKSVGLIFQYTQLAEFAVTLLASVILFFGADWLAINYFKSEQALQLIYIFCIYLVANSIFTAVNSLFIGFQDEKFYSSMHFIRLVFILVFSGFFWFFDMRDVLYYAVTWMVSTLLVVLFYYILVIRMHSFIFKNISWNSKLFKSMVSYGVPTLITTSLYTFMSSTDTLFLTYFHGLKDVGIYNVVYPLATLSGLFLTPINALILPLISHLMEGEEEKIVNLIHSILKIVPFIGLYFGLFIALFPSAIATTLFGTKWGGLVETPLIIFSLGYIMSPLSNFLVIILSGMGKTQERLQLSIFVAVLNIILCLILIPHFGVVGAVIANTIVYFVSVAVFTNKISGFFKLTFSFDFYFKLALFGALIFGIVKAFAISPNGILQIFISGAVYTAVFAIFGITQEVLDTKTKDLLVKRITRT